MTTSRSAGRAGRRAKVEPAGRAGPQASPGAEGVDGRDAPPGRDPGDADRTMLLVGSRVRAMRLRQGLTLKDVAERTGVSVSMLSMLERGVAAASIGTLVSVTSALGVHMYDLFDHPDARDGSPVTKLSEQSVVRLEEGTTRRVAHHDPEAGLELAVNEYEQGAASGPSPTHHEGREFGVLIAGRLTVELEGRLHELEPGDVIAYASTRPHRIVNAGEGRAVAVWVNLDRT